MTRLSDDCFAGDDRPMRLDEALATLLPRLPVLAGIERVPLAQALDRILAADVNAHIDVPAADNSAVDGYAVYFDDLDPRNETRLPVGGRAAAGHPLDRPARRGEAIRIFTGAPMPAGSNADGPDTVLMQEDCVEQKGIVTIGPGIARGANRRRAGEDLARGTIALAAGTRLRPQDIGLAASLGTTDLAVRTKLRVALFSTGDEIAEPGRSLEPGRIYDSNRYTLAALLTQLGLVVSDLGILPDRRDAVAAALVDAARDHDAIVTSGGVSVGEEDHVKAAVTAHGHIHLWRLAIKPGRPVALGQIVVGDARRPFFGLPGNPVAVGVTFLRLMRPMLLKMMGASRLEPHMFRVRADFTHRKKPARREWVPARLVADGSGGLMAQKFEHPGAGILRSLVQADGLVELPEDLTALAPGTPVDFLPFSEVSR
ncbi:MAG: gephyrin-like molybdotransferase Glp [Dongiaceae bacterium]